MKKRLNNKGFTLIELLAVVVILAVVMGIATTSVLSSMNNSRKGSLQNSAESAAQIFQNKYAESMVTGTASSVFGKYNFNVGTTTFYPLITSVGSDLNLSNKAYALTDDTNVTAMTDFSAVDKSFVAFDGEKIVACLVANSTGSYYVGQATTTKTATVLGTTVTFADGTMFACSNEAISW